MVNIALTDLTPSRVNNLDSAQCLDIIADMGLVVDYEASRAELRDTIRYACISHGVFEPEDLGDQIGFQMNTMEGLPFQEKGKAALKLGFANKRPAKVQLPSNEIATFTEATATTPSIQQPGRGYNRKRAREYGNLMSQSDLDMTAPPHGTPLIVANITDRPDIRKPAILDGTHRYRGSEEVCPRHPDRLWNCLLYDATWVEAKRELLRINSDYKINRDEGVIKACIKAAFNDPVMYYWTYGLIARWIVCDVSYVSKVFGAMYHETGREPLKRRMGMMRNKVHWFPVGEISDSMRAKWAEWAREEAAASDSRTSVDPQPVTAEDRGEQLPAKEVYNEILDADDDLFRQQEMLVSTQNQDLMEAEDNRQRRETADAGDGGGVNGREPVQHSMLYPGDIELAFTQVPGSDTAMVKIIYNSSTTIDVPWEHLSHFHGDVRKKLRDK